MKKIPETFELDENDIKEAIAYWLNEGEHSDGEGYSYDFDISLQVKEVQEPPPGGHRGGMSDPVIKNVFTARAVKE